MTRPTNRIWCNTDSIRWNRSGVGASVLVPARLEGHGLLRSLPAIGAAADQLAREMGAEVEILLLAERGDTATLSRAVECGAAWGVRPIPLRHGGKFQALRVGARAATGDLLVLADADILPPRSAFQQLCRPLLSGCADVALSRPATLPPLSGSRGSGSLVLRWGQLSLDAWDLLRTRHQMHLWALPGQLYALRRGLFPDAALVPLIDDASIGVHALEQGARFRYERDVAVAQTLPANYWQWCRQKFRTRQGWAMMRRWRPTLVRDLEQKLYICLEEVCNSDRLADILLPWHDKQLRRLAGHLTCGPRARIGVWKPPRRSRT
jgi:hypothetical protein